MSIYSHSISSIVTLVLCISLQSCDSKKRRVLSSYDELTLAWSDEFDNDGIPDSSKWTYDLGNGCPQICGWGNNEEQSYTNSEKNARVVDGQLIIEAHHEDLSDRNFSSARLVSKGLYDWQYGTVEVKAKLPVGLGTWPAIWMLPSDNTFGGWPSSGEIDIMEHVGYSPDSVLGTVHTEAFNHILGTQDGGVIVDKNTEVGFHTYKLVWTPDHMNWYMDGEKYHTFHNRKASYKEWPFDQPFHIILNLAVGGNWGGKHGVATDIWPQQFVVDYVRVYQ